MKILDMENKTGLERATIRYYEREGLITPAREENSYRNYSEQDAEELLKIKLLRQLEIPVETIRELQTGDRSFGTVMGIQLQNLSREEQAVLRKKEICRQICQDVTSYRGLDAPYYLDALSQPGSAVPGVPVETFWERKTWEVHPFRRMIARVLDWNLLVSLVLLLVYVVFRVRPFRPATASFLMLASWWLMIPTEGLLLHLLGTTPGKWVMGIRVEYFEGGRLSVSSAVSREWRVFLHGMALNIPAFRLYRLYKSYKEHVEYADMSWDDESIVCYSRWGVGGKCLAAGLLALIVGLDVWTGTDALLPQNRGNDLTVAQFSENYNGYAEAYGYSDMLMADGSWQPDPYIVVYIEGTPPARPSRFRFETEDGFIRRITYENTVERMWFESILPVHCRLAAISAVAAQPGMTGWEYSRFVAALSEESTLDDVELRGTDMPIEGTITWRNVTISWRGKMLEEKDAREDRLARVSCHILFTISIAG